MSPEFMYIEEDERDRAIKAYVGTGATLAGLTISDFIKPGPTYHKEEVRDLAWQSQSTMGKWLSCASVTSHVSESLPDLTESPFERIAEILTDREKARQLQEARDLIKLGIEGSNIPFASRLAARLYYLYETVEEDPEEGPVSAESLQDFVNFLQDTPNLKYPDVVLTPSNEISAQWREGANRLFSVVFQAGQVARFVIFKPNSKDPNEIDRLSGTTLVGTLMENVEPYGVRKWAF